MEEVKRMIRDVPDFPKPGIIFKDITPVLHHPPAFKKVVDWMAEQVTPLKPDVICAIESRGFLFGAALAYKLGIALAPVRKPGKLPYKTRTATYSLEYGTDSLQIHEDAIRPGDRVVVIDDLLATGGTAAATAGLAEELGGKVVQILFLIELGFLQGRSKLGDRPMKSLITF